MKKYLSLLTVLSLTFVMAGCGDGGNSSGDNPSAGDKTVYSAGGVLFTMIYVPAGTFPKDTNRDGIDDSAAVVSNAYQIAETETTYELWSTVKAWATDPARGTNKYQFANTGHMGGGTGSFNIHHPATMMNWRDAIVWCNALTEWYNSLKGTSYTCAYYTDQDYTTPLRTSTNNSTLNTNPGKEDNPYIKAATAGNTDMLNCTASGFRLLTANEWELAARYIADDNDDGDITESGEFYPSNHVSGDASSYCYPNDSGTSTSYGNYAVYTDNSGGHTAEVKTRTICNSLGIYDMSGNVWEWCFEWDTVSSPDKRIMRGGCYGLNAWYLQVGNWTEFDPYYSGVGDFGIRIGRSN